MGRHSRAGAPTTRGCPRGPTGPWSGSPRPIRDISSSSRGLRTKIAAPPSISPTSVRRVPLVSTQSTPYEYSEAPRPSKAVASRHHVSYRWMHCGLRCQAMRRRSAPSLLKSASRGRAESFTAATYSRPGSSGRRCSAAPSSAASLCRWGYCSWTTRRPSGASSCMRRSTTRV